MRVSTQSFVGRGSSRVLTIGTTTGMFRVSTFLLFRVAFALARALAYRQHPRTVYTTHVKSRETKFYHAQWRCGIPEQSVGLTGTDVGEVVATL